MTWGRGLYGRLGLGDEQNRTWPAKLGREVFGGSAVMMVSCGGFPTRRRSTHINSKRCVTNQGVLDSKPLQNDVI